MEHYRDITHQTLTPSLTFRAACPRVNPCGTRADSLHLKFLFSRVVAARGSRILPLSRPSRPRGRPAAPQSLPPPAPLLPFSPPPSLAPAAGLALGSLVAAAPCLSPPGGSPARGGAAPGGAPRLRRSCWR